jgi:hypothetical protein
MTTYITLAKFKDISRQVPARYSMSCCNQTAPVDESGVIKTQMGTRRRSVNSHIAWDVLYDTTE